MIVWDALEREVCWNFWPAPPFIFPSSGLIKNFTVFQFVSVALAFLPPFCNPVWFGFVLESLSIKYLLLYWTSLAHECLFSFPYFSLHFIVYLLKLASLVVGVQQQPIILIAVAGSCLCFPPSNEASKLTPLLQFSLSPHHGGLEKWACHEILQKLSPCSCRSDSVVQTLLWSDLSLWSVMAWRGMSWTRSYSLLQEGRACSPPSWIPSMPSSRLQSALHTPHLSNSPCTSSGTHLIVR